jgi:methyl-accepting chemotaxis protein
MSSIRMRMLVFFGLSSAALLIVLALVIFIRIKTALIPLTESMSKEIVHARSDEIGRLVEGYLREIKTLGEHDVYVSGSIDAIKKDFEKRNGHLNKDFDYLFYAGTNGINYTSLKGSSNISDRDYYKAIMNDGKDYFVSMPLIAKSTGRKIFVVAYAVKDKGGATSGLLAAAVKLDTLSEIAGGIKIGTSGFGWIIDGSGVVIAYPKEEYLMKLNVAKSADMGFKGLDTAGKIMMEGQPGIERIFTPEGVKIVILFNPIEGTPHWTLGVSVPEREFMDKAYSLLWTVSIIIFVILTLMFITINIIARLISKPLGKTSEHLSIIGTGNFMQELPVNFTSKKDEVGIIWRSLGKMQESIRKAVLSMQQASEELATASEEMSSTSVSFAENAQSSASTVEELTAAIEEISAGMDSVSDGTQYQREHMISLISAMDDLEKVLIETDDRITEALGTGESIVDRAHEGAGSLNAMNSTMTAITDSSRDMMNIVKIINDISDQINLLSLNAAIEAARAGDAGRGFAVVADEISKLAEQTAQSLKDIDRLIRQNSEEIEKGKVSIDATTSTIKSVTEGIALIADRVRSISSAMARQTKIYEEVQTQAKSVKNRSDEISNSMEEQKIAVREVMQSISSINDVTQENAAGAEQMASSTENVSALAERLWKDLEYFKVR